MATPKLLPMHLGVSASRVSLPAGDWITLLDFLCHRFPAIGREEWVARIHKGHVLHEDHSAVGLDEPYTPHQFIFYYRDVPQEATLPQDAQVLFEDEHVLVADKPHFMLVTPGGRYLQSCLLVQLKRLTACESLTPIHRIDRETAGLVLFSINPKERNAYQAMFRDHAVTKHYEAIAPWRQNLTWPITRKSRIIEDEPFFRQREVPGQPNSETHMDMIEKSGGLARYALSPVTGKKHQLRVHMNALGLPILNDRMYPPVAETPDDDYRLPLQLLAKNISFIDPLKGVTRVFTSELKLAY